MSLEQGYSITTKGMSQEIPDPLCRAAIVVGPPKDGIQKNPSVSNPFNKVTRTSQHKQLETKNDIDYRRMRYPRTSFATFERAWYKPIHTGIVAKVGKHPVERIQTALAEKDL